MYISLKRACVGQDSNHNQFSIKSFTISTSDINGSCHSRTSDIFTAFVLFVCVRFWVEMFTTIQWIMSINVESYLKLKSKNSPVKVKIDEFIFIYYNQPAEESCHGRLPLVVECWDFGEFISNLFH